MESDLPTRTLMTGPSILHHVSKVPKKRTTKVQYNSTSSFLHLTGLGVDGLAVLDALVAMADM